MSERPSKISKISYSKETVSDALFLLNSGYSARHTDSILNIKSKQTVLNWKNQDMSENAVEERRESIAHNRLLSKKNESIVAGWIIFRCILKKSTTRLDVKNFLFDNFDLNVNSNWLHFFMKRQHLSLLEPSIAKGAELNKEKVQEAVHFLDFVKSLNKKPIQIAVLDKTKFYYDSRRVKHVSIQGGGRPRKKLLSRGAPDTMYSLLVANGTLGPLYIESSVKKNVKNVTYDSKKGDVVFLHKHTRRRGETGMLNFIENCVADKTLLEGDLLLTDNEASFKTKKVLKLLKKN